VRPEYRIIQRGYAQIAKNRRKRREIRYFKLWKGEMYAHYLRSILNKLF
jgi:hypothetical protein